MSQETIEVRPEASRRRRGPGFVADLLGCPGLFVLVIVFVVFGLLAPKFFTFSNLRNILVQSSSVGILAVGMTVVLLIGGIDLSVGSIMFIAAAIAGKLVLGDLIPGLAPVSTPAAVGVILLIGLGFGGINALLIARLGMMPFVVTLAAMFVGRGLGLQITEIRPLHLPDNFLHFGPERFWGIEFPILLFVGVVLAGHVLLIHTPLGRQIYALGNNPEAARKAGINTRRLTALVYVLSGLCAALAGIVSVSQLGEVSPKLGEQREFAAIAAAALGGTSLFGGRGKVLPGTLLGAVLIQAMESGLVMVKANEYIYPMVIAGTIFVAVLVDRLRSQR